MSRANTLRVSAVQLSSTDKLERNLAECWRWVEAAAKDGPDVIVLPENFAFLGSEADKRSHAERLGDTAGPIQAALAGMARRAGAFVVGGGMPERSADPDRPYNSAVVYSPSGECVAVYRKMHLFDADLPNGERLRESGAVSAGAEPVVVVLRGVTVGLSICYDLRFPEFYRVLVDRGAEVLMVPAAFTHQTGKAHWQVLLRARAIESEAWVVGANQWGEHSPGRTSYGHSAIIDPWGTPVAECPDGPGVIAFELDLGYARAVRSRLPSLRHRRIRW
ncbi:MAG: carbon-nitrogen hydrolase family protein [Polyangiaceae bacterium]|nr:carbon-nitrogen hydrolase family protein [Polyangiaceae bacterium]